MKDLYDYVIVGSGFGGSVSAMRLAEKGYSVLVIEKGKRYENADFPQSNWNIRKFLWAPLLRCFGIQQLSFFKDVFVLSGTGVGGGSLVYANTHMYPPDQFFNNPSWCHFKDWKQVLQPFYTTARRMLGTVPYTDQNREDEILKEIAGEMGSEASFGNVEVGVYFGEKGENCDPYFNGHGPKRNGCVNCAGCMVGCRFGAKNTLDKNYLWFAEKLGAEVLPETEVVSILPENDGYMIETRSSTAWIKGKKRSIRAKGLVVSAGVLGTLKLLLKSKYHDKTLDRLSDTLGHNLRTNSESLCGVAHAKEKLNNGVAITSVFNPDEHTHIEIVKYPDGSGLMGRLATLATDGAKPYIRPLRLIGNLITHPLKTMKLIFPGNWSTNAVILLVMQSLDNSLKMVWKKGIFGGGITMKTPKGQGVPAYISVGQEVMHRYAEKSGGMAMNAFSEVMFDMSTTAHILGGCPMSSDPSKGVVDEFFAVHGYKNLYILDGSIMPCNLGVNPSLTITALTEYAMSHIPDSNHAHPKSLDDLMKAPGPNS